MNLKYLFCGAIVATTLQLKSSNEDTLRLVCSQLFSQGPSYFDEHAQEPISAEYENIEPPKKKPRKEKEEEEEEAFLSPEGLKELLETVARRAAADPEHEKKEERRKQKLRLLDFLDARIERAYSDLLNQINLYEKLSKDLKGKLEDEGTQQCIWSEETKLSRLYEEITNLEQERNELVEVLYK